MIPHALTTKWLRPTLTSLVLVCAASLAQAQTAKDYIVNQFDDGTTGGWSPNYGPAPMTIEFDPTQDHGPGLSPGALKCTINFNLCSNLTQRDFERTLSPTLDLTKYTALHFSVKVDPSSSHLSDWGAGAFGNMRPHIRLSDWSGDSNLGSAGGGAQWVGADAYTNWVDYTYPIDQTLPNLPVRQAMGVWGFDIWSGWGTCAAPIGHTNTVIFWLDNIWFEWNTNTAPPTPPTTALAKAGTPGLMIAMGAAGGQWDRQAVVTPGPGSNYIWTAQGGYPVSYSCTITDFPPVGTHLGYEAHMYIVNGDTAPSGAETGGSPDWGCPDIFIFRVENHVTTTYTTNGTVITTNRLNDAMAQIQWKTNYPNANSTNIPVVVFPPSVPGTWTVTFTDATHGSLSGPGITTTNFTLPADVVTSNFSPLTNFVQFGCFKNDGANDGHNDNATGTFGHVQIAGNAASINEDFSSPTLTNKYAWRKTSANSVQFIAPGTAWFFNWSVPAYGFNPFVAPSVKGPWSPLALASQFQIGTNITGAVAKSALPAGDEAFFRMTKYPFVKLQVLMPGETAAPFTTTGKTGTPTAQTAGVPFNIIVNAVDQFWNITDSSDVVGLTSNDAAFGAPASAALVGGSKTFSVNFGFTGTWTVTATDETDGTKTPNTGSPTVSQ